MKKVLILLGLLLVTPVAAESDREQYLLECDTDYYSRYVDSYVLLKGGDGHLRVEELRGIYDTYDYGLEVEDYFDFYDFVGDDTNRILLYNSSRKLVMEYYRDTYDIYLYTGLNERVVEFTCVKLDPEIPLPELIKRKLEND